MKKKKIQNIILAAIAIGVIGAIVAYNYSVDQTKQIGFQFGVELEQIQEELKELQTKFYSEKTSWEEGDITKEELLQFYDNHLKEFNELITRYDNLNPPELFEGSVELLKLSSETQLQSDSEFIEWIKTGNESSKVRSDNQFQESLNYEMQGLVEYYSAKTGVKNYDDPEFEAPLSGLAQKVLQVAEDMKEKCDDEFRNDAGEFDSDEVELEWFNCFNEAERWKIEHLP